MPLHTPVHRWRYALGASRFAKKKKMSNCAFPRAVASFLYRESRPVARLLFSKPHVKIFMLYLPLKFGINKMPLPVQVFNFQVSQTDYNFAFSSMQRLLKPNIQQGFISASGVTFMLSGRQLAMLAQPTLRYMVKELILRLHWNLYAKLTKRMKLVCTNMVFEYTVIRVKTSLLVGNFVKGNVNVLSLTYRSASYEVNEGRASCSFCRCRIDE